MHNGQTGGYSSYLKVNPTHRFGVVVLANRSTSSTTELGEKLNQVLFGESAEAESEDGAIDQAD